MLSSLTRPESSRLARFVASRIQLLRRSAGHSLGGALAQLAAHDIAKLCQDCGKTVRVGCYTYGSPRVGNHAFAREFDKVATLPHNIHAIHSAAGVKVSSITMCACVEDSALCRC